MQSFLERFDVARKAGIETDLHCSREEVDSHSLQVRHDIRASIL